MSRHNQRMDYWAGALPGSRKCECGVLGSCVDPSKWCNCDAGQSGTVFFFFCVNIIFQII